MEKLKLKLDEIIDTGIKKKTKIWGMDCIEEIQNKFSLVFPTDYMFYLQYYGNDYIKDYYSFTLSNSMRKIFNQNSFELDSIFGLYDDTSNLEKKILFYQDVIPSNLFPIADLPGGNLICMDKESQAIYFWIHDEVVGTYLVAHNFSIFIMQFQFEEKEQANLDDIELNLSNDLNDLLRQAAEKYR